MQVVQLLFLIVILLTGILFVLAFLTVKCHLYFRRTGEAHSTMSSQALTNPAPKNQVIYLTPEREAALMDELNELQESDRG